MTETKRLTFLTDRSAVETDDTCGMKFWLNRKEGGRGIVPKEESFHFLIGRETHLDLATIAEMEDISPESIEECIADILAPLTDDDKLIQDKMEVLYRRLGWLAAFALYVEPTIRRDYDTIGIEKELILDRDPLYVAVTPDRVLRSKADGSIVYKEYKTALRCDPKWSQSWLYAIQLHLGIAAVQEEIKQKVSFAQIMGLLKGYESYTDGRRMHPYVWAYYNTKSAKWEHRYESARGPEWVPMPVWEYPGGIVKWVQFCGEDVARSQFPHSPPVFLNQRILDEWIARRLHRERRIKQVESACHTNLLLRSVHFERRTSKCRPAFGDPCPYLLACWNAEIASNPLLSGDYVPRVPHHDVEIVGMI